MANCHRTMTETNRHRLTPLRLAVGVALRKGAGAGNSPQSSDACISSM